MGGDDWITVPTAARLLGLQLHTVYRLIENGELGGVDTYGVCLSGRPRRRRWLVSMQALGIGRLADRAPPSS